MSPGTVDLDPPTGCAPEASIAKPSLTVDPAQLRVGCVMDGDPRFHRDALTFLRSLRWFGGALAQADVLICAVDGVPPEVRRDLEALGAEVRVVPRFLESNGSSNRFRWFEEAARDRHLHYLHVDCDVFVARDPLGLLRPDVLQAKPAAVASITTHVFERLFRHFDLPLPAVTTRTGWTGVGTIPYHNAGVLAGPAALFARLLPAWHDFNVQLGARPELAAPCEKHLHQAALTLAVVASGVALVDAPEELNYQLNLEHLAPSSAFLEVDPALVHHHGRFDERGMLREAPYPIARWRIERLNARLRTSPAASSDAAPSFSRSTLVAEPVERVFVLGMHRAGTSAVTRTLNLMGLAVGPADRLPTADEGNPLGYWENSDVVLLNDALLAAGGNSWSDPLGFSVDGVSDEPRARFVEAARELTAAFDRHGDWVTKDPRLCLTLPAWLEPGAHSLAVVVHRDPLAVARSLRSRHGLGIAVGLGLWEFYLRSALAASSHMPRVFVAYGDLVSRPEETAARWREALTRAGVRRLRPADGVAQFVDPQLDRSGRPSAEHGELTGTQSALAAALDAATRGDVDALECLPPFDSASGWLVEQRERAALRQRALALDHRDALIASLEEERRYLLGRLEEERRQLLGRLEERRHLLARLEEDDSLLRAVFASTGWRLGSAVGRSVAWLRRPFRKPDSNSLTVLERWRARRPTSG